MKKSRAVVGLIVYVLILGLLGYTAIFGVGSDKSGSAGSIKLGLDLAGGVSITYQVVGDEEPNAEDMSDTIYKLQQRVDGYSTEAQVYQEGKDRINIEIPGVSDANTILEELGKPGSLYFIAQTGSDGSSNYDMIGYGIDAEGNLATSPAWSLTTAGGGTGPECTPLAVPAANQVSTAVRRVLRRTGQVEKPMGAQCPRFSTNNLIKEEYTWKRPSSARRWV